MVREMLGPVRARTKGDPTDRYAVVCRGVAEGARSLTVYFNVYVNYLAKDVE